MLLVTRSSVKKSVTAKIAIVGEAWGEAEESARSPFVGPSGWELNKMLDEAGIHRADCFLTNVFNLRPERNEIEQLCTDKNSGIVRLGPLKTGKYIKAEYVCELERLQSELASLRPNVTIALGNTAAWALLGTSGISKIRGTVSTDLFGRKCLPTFHPAAVLRDWSLRHVTVLDLAKAGRESAFPEIRRPERTVYIEPQLPDIEWYFNEFILKAESLSFDIETFGDQITCIGFAPSPHSAIVIPFRDLRQLDAGRKGSYWATVGLESEAWGWVRRILSLPMPKHGQNTLYDINFLWAKYGIPVTNYSDDTMLLHHALQPESQKGLGFLGSVYSNESSWKLMNRKTSTIKRDA